MPLPFFGKGKQEGPAMAKDPVCGMKVDPKKAAASYEYKGQTYYFCAPGCKRAFEKEPERYLAGYQMNM
ncbi:MAG: YHS domain-containing protein [Chloroflexota bacterium]